ncbi:MAG: hypothetical protein ACHQZR_05475 [Candidatus Limnocylindrales bacterium]
MRRHRFEDRLVAEASPRVAARLARLGGGAPWAASGPDPVVTAPAAAGVPVAQSSPPPAPSLQARPRSISSALVPWAGNRAAAASAASTSPRPGYVVGAASERHSGESAVMQQAAMVSVPTRWRAVAASPSNGNVAPETRWRIWRDASAALVAFALVALVLLGGDLLRLPAGPPPVTPAVVVAVLTPSLPPRPTPVAVAVAPEAQPPLSTATPIPATPTPAPTPPVTGFGGPQHQSAVTPHPRPRPTPRPKPRPTPTPPTPVAAFVCSLTNVPVGTPVTCEVPVDNGPKATYDWTISFDGGPFTLASTSAILMETFDTPGQYTIQLVVTRAGVSAPGSGVIQVDPAP